MLNKPNPDKTKNPVLKIENVSQEFRTGFWMSKVKVLQDISLEVPRNSIFGLLGANGAGKTSLIYLVVGVRATKEGTILINGFPVSSVEARGRLGYLPERPYFHEHLTGAQLLTYLGRLSGMGFDEIEKKIPEVLDTVGIGQAVNKELKKYSKGMLQRLGIAQTLLHDPHLLVLDEPMSGLDPLGRKEIRELIKNLAEQGKTIFFSTHITSDVELICDHLALIRKGKLVKSGEIGDFIEHGDVTEIAVRGVDKDRIRLTLAPQLGENFEIKEYPEGFQFLVPNQNKVSPVLKKVLESNAEIISVTRNRNSLEDLFTPEKSESEHLHNEEA